MTAEKCIMSEICRPEYQAFWDNHPKVKLKKGDMGSGGGMNCPKCGKEYEWRFEHPSWYPDALSLNAYCDCGYKGELVDKVLEGGELEQHKAYIADYLFWERASYEQKIARMKERDTRRNEE